MKNKELIKNLIRLKLQTIDGSLELLPGEMQGFAKEMEKDLISILNEVTAEFLQKEATEKEKKDLKPVAID
ncbi:MAG TPA: hypothetical protein GXZ26_05200 [Firmicutes bacterium]|jgi:hypothetical protein|nr:hypothetical protein [Bacillota bacterium]